MKVTRNYYNKNNKIYTSNYKSMILNLSFLNLDKGCKTNVSKLSGISLFVFRKQIGLIENIINNYD